MRLSRKRAQALQYLRWILALEEINSQETVMRRHAQRRKLARLEEVADVLHLDEGHGATFVLDARRGHHNVDKLAKSHAIFERVEQVPRRQWLPQRLFNPSSCFLRRLRCVSRESQVAHILVERSYGRHVR